jgi:membrane-associated phospholipid phosphatase
MSFTTYEPLTRGMAAEARGWLRMMLQTIMRGFRSHASLYSVALATYAIGFVQSLWLGVPLSLSLVGLVSGTTFVCLLLIVYLWLFWEFIRACFAGYKTGMPAAFGAMKTRVLGNILAPVRVSNTFHAFLTNGVFFVGFMTIKKNIPVAVPFSWDQPFMELDRILHFGMLPHEILAPLFNLPIITFAMNVVYNLWFLVLTAFFFWQGFRKEDTPLRQRYLLSYLLTWAIGTCVLGTVFSSAGPCFYGFVEQGANPYTGLMNYLAEANTIYPIWAVPTQDTLWQSHLAGFGEIEGVSAMPSMHVATTILFILCALASGKRWLVRFTIIFAITIFLGSILLGWHYAVDGYAGALIAIACWKLSGWWVARTAKAAA